jgi:hypothetical protein
MSTSTSDLLTPSLTDAARMPIFSVNAMIAAAFFGGGFAVLLLATENARRLGRLRFDWPSLVLALFVFAVIPVFGLWYMHNGSADAEDIRRNVRLTTRIVGFAGVGAFYWLHRHAHRTLRATGADPASPYVAVIAGVLLSVAVNLGLFRLATSGILWEIR